ncbi:hypothetical protein Tco_0251185 [Tanacetum coccineum]
MNDPMSSSSFGSLFSQELDTLWRLSLSGIGFNTTVVVDTWNVSVNVLIRDSNLCTISQLPEHLFVSSDLLIRLMVRAGCCLVAVAQTPWFL